MFNGALSRTLAHHMPLCGRAETEHTGARAIACERGQDPGRESARGTNTPQRTPCFLEKTGMTTQNERSSRVWLRMCSMSDAFISDVCPPYPTSMQCSMPTTAGAEESNCRHRQLQTQTLCCASTGRAQQDTHTD